MMLHVINFLTIGEMVAMMQVLVRPPSESASRRVSLESRYGMWPCSGSRDSCHPVCSHVCCRWHSSRSGQQLSGCFVIAVHVAML